MHFPLTSTVLPQVPAVSQRLRVSSVSQPGSLGEPHPCDRKSRSNQYVFGKNNSRMSQAIIGLTNASGASTSSAMQLRRFWNQLKPRKYGPTPLRTPLRADVMSGPHLFSSVGVGLGSGVGVGLGSGVGVGPGGAAGTPRVTHAGKTTANCRRTRTRHWRIRRDVSFQILHFCSKLPLQRRVQPSARRLVSPSQPGRRSCWSHRSPGSSSECSPCPWAADMSRVSRLRSLRSSASALR
jgi:hypothetical protein